MKKDNEEFIKKLYEYKSDEDKNTIKMNWFLDKVEETIYKNLNKYSSEVISNIMNINLIHM